MNEVSCVITIPYYNSELSELEEKSLYQALNIFKGRAICFICPESIVIPEKYVYVSTVRFEDKHFQSLANYNQLMLSDFFYKKFLQYDYLLIYQLDAFVFKDELSYWCSLNFDYYGAPWNKKVWRFKYFNLFGLINKNVGNGGFSLRKISTFHLMAKRITRIKRFIRFGEDIFWCNFGGLFYHKFSIVNYDAAIKFAFESDPQSLYLINNRELPFGCHAYLKNNFAFWRKFIFNNSTR